MSIIEKEPFASAAQQNNSTGTSTANNLVTTIDINNNGLLLECLGRDYYISEKYCTKIQSNHHQDGSVQEKKTINWKSIPKFEKKPKLEYLFILKEMEDFVEELDEKCSFEFSSKNLDQFSHHVHTVENGLERIVQITNDFFNLHSSYYSRKGDLEKTFNNLIIILTSLTNLTKDYMSEGMKSDLIVSKYGEMANRVTTDESSSLTTIQESTHFQLISKILQEQVLSLQSKIMQFKEIKKTQFEINIKQLQRVDKYSL